MGCRSFISEEKKKKKEKKKMEKIAVWLISAYTTSDVLYLLCECFRYRNTQGSQPAT